MLSDSTQVRVLWVTALEPRYDAGGGGHIRQAHLLDALSARWETHLLLAGTLRDDRLRRRLAGVREVDARLPPEPASRNRRRLQDLQWALVDRLPREVAQHRGVRAALRPLLGTGDGFDLVSLEQVGLAPLLPGRRPNHWALNLHNLTSGMADHEAAITGGRRQRLLHRLEARNSRRFEDALVADFDTVVAVSDEDAAALPPGAVVVPNGVDTGRFRPTPHPDSHRVAFVGALHTQPNVDGILWFCREVWPIVRRLVPTATLDVVGARPRPAVVDLGRLDGVAVHADVPSTVPFFERSRVIVVPLRIGTGTRLKALEGMAVGRAIVGTSVGLGGLGLEAGHHALVADDTHAFAAAVVDCVTDAALVARLGGAARTIVEERYSWAAIGARYVDLVDGRLSAPSAVTARKRA